MKSKIVILLVLVFLLVFSPLAVAQTVSTNDQNATPEQLAQLNAQANPLEGVLNGILSNVFIYFLILLVVCIVFVPFGIKGILDVWHWADDNFWKPGSGQIRIRQKLPNDRMRVFWVKPSGKLISFKTIEGIKIEMPIKLEKGWMLYEGNIPIIYLDSMNQQIEMGAKWNFPTISQEEVTRGYKNAYETGKFIGAADFFNELKTWLIITLVMAAVSAIISGYFGYTIMKSVENINSKISLLTPEAIASEVIKQLGNSTLNQPISGVQTVGGR